MYTPLIGNDMQAIEWQFCCEPYQSFKLVCSTVDQLTSCHLTVNCMAPQQQSNSAKSSITATHRCASYFTMGWQIITKNVPSCGGSGLPSNTMFLGPTQVCFWKWHPDQCSHICTAHLCVQHTVTHI